LREKLTTTKTSGKEIPERLNYTERTFLSGHGRKLLGKRPSEMKTKKERIITKPSSYRKTVTQKDSGRRKKRQILKRLGKALGGMPK